MFYELWLTGADPNGLVSPHGLGATAVNLANGHLYQCTGLPSTWTDYDPAAGGSGWLHVGTVVRLTTLTDTVVMGAASMLGAERLRVVGVDAVSNALVDELVVEHQTTGAAAPGMGVGIRFVGETSINTTMDFGRVSATATNTTAGAETSGLDFWVRAGGTALTKKWAISGAGNWVADADNVYAIGDNVNRLQSVSCNLFRSFANSTDVNPTATMSTAGFATGLGGASVLDWFLQHAAVAGRSDMGTGNVMGAWGANAGFAVRGINTDVNPMVLLTSSVLVGGQLLFGPGGASVLSEGFSHTSASHLTFSDAAAGSTATLETKGSLISEGRSLGKVFRLAAGGVYNVAVTDDFVGMNTDTAPQTIALPAVATVPEGHRVIVKNTSPVATVNAAVVTPNGGETIDAVAAVVNLTGTQSITLISQNSAGVTGWFLI
jgi:hypothetical protein